MTHDSTPSVQFTVAEFDAATGGDLAARTVARMKVRGLDVTWTSGVTWRSRRGRAHELIAHLDIQGWADATEVIVRIIATRWGFTGKIRSKILIGAYVGGGWVDGRYDEPRFLCESVNHPSVRAARNALGLD